MKSLEGRAAIVTGGAQGIGGATARRLAEAGVSVLIADFDVDAAAENVERIRSAGGQAEAIETDVSRPEDVRSMVERAVSLWERLDILVNNAWGRRGSDGSALTLTEEAWDYGVNTMVKAHFLGAKHAVPHMRAGGWGRIVNIASVHGFMNAPNKLSYQSCKAAVIALSRQMACDFGPMGITVNSICPGHIVTERMQQRWDANPTYLRFFEEQYPVRRVGTPDDIAHSVRFLCTDEASFITGHTMVIDGGLTIQLQEDMSIHMAQFYRDHPETELPE